MTESWTTNAEQTTSIVTGRTLVSWRKKINPIWWLGNDGEPWPPDWYMPGKSYPIRTVAWYLRNPLENFSNYVIGVSDRNFTVTGMAPIGVTAWNDLPGGRMGWKYSVIHIGWIKLPFVSYVGKRVMFYIGWETGGFAGAKFNLLNSPVQIV